MAIEEPEYSVVVKAKDYVIRKYDPVLVAETTVMTDFKNAGSKGFQILAGYIFGKNKSKSKIAMTAPVGQQLVSEKISMTAPVTLTKAAAGYLIQFTMPKTFTLKTLPTPDDKSITLREVPARKIAVYTYSGLWTESHYKDKLSEFKALLKNDKIITKDEPILARFNSPLKLWFMRRNEIWLELK